MDDTVWLTQKQMAELFAKGRSTATEHIKNAFKERELDEASVVRNFQTTAKEATKFHIWATNVLKDHIIKACTNNK